MTSVWSSLAGALLGGLAVYGLFHWVLWDVPMSSLGNLVGLAAVVGGGLGHWLARRRAAPKTPADARVATDAASSPHAAATSRAVPDEPGPRAQPEATAAAGGTTVLEPPAKPGRSA